MKRQRYKNGLIFLFSILCFTSCEKNKMEDPTLIIDPSPWFTHDALWLEAEKRTGNAGYEPVIGGNSLHLNWNQEDNTITSPFYYKYNPSNLDIKVDQEGYLLMENGLISFLKLRNKTDETSPLVDTVIQVKYILDGEKLIVQDTTASPVMEIIYNKLTP